MDSTHWFLVPFLTLVSQTEQPLTMPLRWGATADGSGCWCGVVLSCPTIATYIPPTHTHSSLAAGG